jgi:hypothetical protein
LFKSLKPEFKILTISPGVVATIHLAGVRGEPCGALRMRCFKGHNTLGSVLFWGFTQRRIVVPDGRFGTKYQSQRLRWSRGKRAGL